MKILSDAERQIRLSSERPTWFTAALLQLGCGLSSDMILPGCSTREQPKEANDAVSEVARESSSSRTVSHPISSFGISNRTLDRKTISVHSSPQVLASHSSSLRLNGSLVYGECKSVDRYQLNDNCSEQWALLNGNSDILSQVWTRCIENCHSKTLKQLLLDHEKLVSIRQLEGNMSCFFSYDQHGMYLSRLLLFTQNSGGVPHSVFKWVTYNSPIIMIDVAKLNKELSFPILYLHLLLEICNDFILRHVTYEKLCLVLRSPQMWDHISNSGDIFDDFLKIVWQ